MSTDNILIIGAGAAGLMAARQLARAGKQVLVLEARDRIGGRIHTLYETGFSIPMESGAEFVHGDLPVSLGLLKEARIAYQEMTGTTYRVKNSVLSESETASIEEWDLLLEKLTQLTEDESIQSFLDTHFAGDTHAELRASVRGFVEGYDAADATRASTLALREEWTGENEAPQYRMPGGYSQLMDFLAEDLKAANGQILLNTVVTTIHWQTGQVTVYTEAGQTFVGTQLLVTVPLGVWQAKPASRGHIEFIPDLPEKFAAAHQLGFGAVIKVLLEFKTAFWEQKPATVAHSMPALGFLFSEAEIPTWWTQLPQSGPVLTGWLAGPNAATLDHLSEEDMLTRVLDSLAYLFATDTAFLRQQMHHYQIIHWTTDPFTRGAYTYATVDGTQARQCLATPVENTLFFAGETFYEGPEMGTVEAALSSGQHAARQVLGQA